MHVRASRGRHILFSRWWNSLWTISHTMHTRTSINDILAVNVRLISEDERDTKTQRTSSAKRNFVERNFYPLNNPLCCNKRLQREKFEAASHYGCIRERARGRKADKQADKKKKARRDR